jgi:hypothetical protein
MIYCDKCDKKSYFGYVRLEYGKHLILCFNCAKEWDKNNDKL